MSSIENKFNYLEETKELIKSAITEKGIEVADEATFRQYPDLIQQIETGIDTTSSKPATSNDIALNKEAFVNGEKVIGTVEEFPAGSGMGFGVEKGTDRITVKMITNNRRRYFNKKGIQCFCALSKSC